MSHIEILDDLDRYPQLLYAFYSIAVGNPLKPDLTSGCNLSGCEIRIAKRPPVWVYRFIQIHKLRYLWFRDI